MDMDSGLTAVIMTGGGGHTEVERLVARAREAITCDTVDKLLDVKRVERIIVATDTCALSSMLAGGPVIVDVDPPGERFHFGRRLTQILDDYHVERCLYVGGGSGPLLAAEEWGEIASAVAETENTVITNNFYSTDFAAWTPARALKSTSLPDNDNELTWTLRFDAGLSVQTLPRSTATQLDVDTPTDLMTLGLHPDCAPHTRRFLMMLELDALEDLAGARMSQPTQGLFRGRLRDSIHGLRCVVEDVLEVLLDRDAEVFVAGRVSAAAAAYLQTEALCRKRILAEERGMRASGRQARGEVRSLLGALLEDRGPRGFFDSLSEMSAALILDSRVVLAHRRSWPSASDRFHSDLRDAEQIRDPLLREFTAAALEASIPVILGGHSLVSGGLWALVDAAWSRVEGEVPRRSGSPERN
jgi:hypothetical protein